MKILIIRHAEPDYKNNTITEKGWREANLLAKRLAKLPLGDIYVSPLGRAQDTAAPTLELTGKSATTLDWLHEFRARVWSEERGKPVVPWNFRPRFFQEHPELMNKDEWLTNEFMQSGNVREVYEETVAELDRLLERYGYVRDGYVYKCEKNLDTTIVLFCHLAMGLLLVSHFTAVAPSVLWRSFFLPTSSVTEIVTEEFVPGEVFFRCRYLGDTSHLYAGDEPISPMGIGVEFYEQKKKK